MHKVSSDTFSSQACATLGYSSHWRRVGCNLVETF